VAAAGAVFGEGLAEVAAQGEVDTASAAG